jgi:hypothetical protein
VRAAQKGDWDTPSKPKSSCPAEVPGIHDFHVRRVKDVDGRDKPGHDEVCARLEIKNQRWKEPNP